MAIDCTSEVAARRNEQRRRSIVSFEVKPMPWIHKLLMRAFGRPKGVLGRLGGVIMARVNRDAAAQVIELLDVRPDDRILEVGFGPGVAIQLLLRRAPTVWVAGVDQSQEMVQQAAARNADALRGRRVDLRYGSADRLPFADATFDKVLAVNSMQVWPDARRGLREIRRVLKDGGIVALAFTANSGQPKEGVAELLADVGFAHARIVDGSKLFCATANKAASAGMPGAGAARRMGH
jgi:SAM-dependent methyltransferase